MPNVEFRPNDPQNPEDTVYNVFEDGVFMGYVAKDWLLTWTYYKDGEPMSEKYYDRCDLFQRMLRVPLSC